MLLLVQLTAATPELKLLVPGAAEEQAPLNIGWRMIDRSHTAASPDCLVLADADATDPVYQLQPLTTVQQKGTHNLKEICVHTGNYVLQPDEQVTVLLDIDTPA
jgi:hypothetical protein